MEGSFFRRSVERPVIFRDQAGRAAFEAKLDNLKLLESATGERQVILEVFVSLPVFQLIEDRQAFGMTRESIDPEVQSWQFTSELPVQLELRAEGAARDELARFQGEELLDHAVLDLINNADSPLLDAVNYLYLGAYQERQTESSSYMVGFRSVYDRR